MMANKEECEATETTSLLGPSSLSESRPLYSHHSEPDAQRIGEGDNDDYDDDSDASVDSTRLMSHRQKLISLTLLLATLTSSFAICLFPPFFPRVAEAKGCSATVYGFIIGTNCITSFIVTPIIGKHLRVMGVRAALIGGTWVGGLCCLLSGLLEFVSDNTSFVLLAVSIRVVHAIGNAFVITATFTFTAQEFHKSVGTVFSLTRMAMSLAQMCGPSIGGLLYGLAGFYMPFLVMGSVQMLMALLALFILPQCSSSSPSSASTSMSSVSVTSLILLPRIWFSFLTFMVATACNGFLSINLERQVLQPFDLSPFMIGLMFGLRDGAGSIASPIWGLLCDRGRHTSVKPYIVLSAVLTATSFVLLGGCPFLHNEIQLTLGVVCFALSLNGVGISGEQVSGIIDALTEAMNAGFPDDPALHGLVAGLWSSLSGLGRFVSRAGSGFLVDRIGFDNTATIAVIMQTVVATLTLIYMLVFECRLRSNKSVRFDNVTAIIDEEDSDQVADEAVIFDYPTSSSSPKMHRSVRVDIQPRRRLSSHNSASLVHSLNSSLLRSYSTG